MAGKNKIEDQPKQNEGPLNEGVTVESLQAEILNLKAANDGYAAEVNDLKAASETLQLEKETLETEKAALETEKTALEVELETLKTEKADLESEIEELKKSAVQSPASSLATQKEKKDKPQLCDKAVEVTFTEEGQERTGKFKLLVASLVHNGENLTAEQALARPEVMRALVEGTTVKGKSVFVQEIFE